MSRDVSGPGEPDYSAIARRETERWREIRNHATELDESVVTSVEQQARALADKLGADNLARIATYRADRWASLARTTRFDANRDHYLSRSQAWHRIAESGK